MKETLSTSEDVVFCCLDHLNWNRNKDRENYFNISQNANTFPSLTMLLAAMLGFWAKAGFFMRPGFLDFGDMDAGDASPFPSEICSSGTPAIS